MVINPMGITSADCPPLHGGQSRFAYRTMPHKTSGCFDFCRVLCYSGDGFRGLWLKVDASRGQSDPRNPALDGSYRRVGEHSAV